MFEGAGRNRMHGGGRFAASLVAVFAFALVAVPVASAAPNDYSIDDVTGLEGNSGTTPFVFTVSKVASSGEPTSVAFKVQHITTNNADLTLSSGKLSFAPSQTTRQVTVPVNGDTVNEPTETFRVRLGHAINGQIVDGIGIGTIIDDDRNGLFSCRATGLRIGTSETSVANPQNVPCADDADSALNVPLGTVLNVGVINASTNQTPDDLSASPPADGDSGAAHADAAAVSLLNDSIGVDVLESDAQATCVGGVPVLTGSSKVTGLRIGTNTTAVITDPVTIPVGIATLQLNQQVVSGGQITQQALRLTSPLLPTIVIGEARADFSGNPCVA